ncbi:MAG TPA: hypothetical protein VKU19_42375 [Bryobacteraceae bacterium]|nr:hypothetical protein [Bryobacteraceae bacterium]
MADRVHRAAMLVGIGELAAILSGAFITGSRIAFAPHQQATGPDAHQFIAIAALLLALGFCVWVSSAGGSRLIRVAAWFAFASLALAGATGWAAPRSPAWLVCHALFSHLSIALMSATLMLSSDGWRQPPEPVSAGSWNFLRPAAVAMPPAVLVQISLGALYRHQIIGVMPHMLGAMVVALLTLVIAVILLQHFPHQRELKTAATALISLVIAQVCLGITVFLILLLGVGDTPWFVWASTGHVCVGTLTFAASVAAAMQVRRYMAPASPAR